LPTEQLCLVHLVWAPLGTERLARFLEACRRNDPGVPHRLLVLWNGFSAQDDLGPWRALLADAEYEQLHLQRPVLDLAAYRQAAAGVSAERYCFTNSYSEPTTPGWLGMLDAALSTPRTGLVGATGSWASTRSWMAHVLRLPSAYRGVMPEPKEAMAGMMEIEADRVGGPGPTVEQRSTLGTARARLLTLAEIPRQTVPFERFPAYHVRTNAFMVSAEVLARLRWREVREKYDTYLMENGRRSITRQVQRMGLRTLVVDRAGVGYEPQQWPASRTFWQGDQEGLLVADNQTRSYAEADADRRRLLSTFAWGPRADPTLP
jgi:hypothetical protein